MTPDPFDTPLPDPAERPDPSIGVGADSPDSPDSPTSPDSPPEAEPLDRDGLAGMDIEHEADADGFWRDEFGNRVDHEGRRVDEDGNRVDAGGNRIDPVDPPIGIVPPIPPR